MARVKNSNSLAENRKARHDYFVEETMEAGIELVGTEVKSIRGGKCNLKDCYADVRNGEIFILNMHISPYEQGKAKEEAKRPFAQEAELAEKSARLAELNSLLNMDEKGSEDALGVDEDAAETEVADRPCQPVNYAGRVAERTADNARKPSVLAQLHAKQAERSAEPQKSQKRKSHNMEL